MKEYTQEMKCINKEKTDEIEELLEELDNEN